MLGGAVDDTAAEHEPCGLGRIAASLRGDGVGLALLQQGQVEKHRDLAVLEDRCRVAEDEGVRETSRNILK